MEVTITVAACKNRAPLRGQERVGPPTQGLPLVETQGDLLKARFIMV